MGAQRLDTLRVAFNTPRFGIQRCQIARLWPYKQLGLLILRRRRLLSPTPPPPATATATATHTFHRAGRRDQYAHARARCARGRRRTEHATQSYQGFPGTNHSSVNYHELGQWARCNRGYAERDRRTCPYREERGLCT